MPTDTDTDTDTADQPSTPESEPIGLVYVTVENDNAPDECAIYPDGASDTELMTTWISAQGDSFVALEAMR